TPSTTIRSTSLADWAETKEKNRSTRREAALKRLFSWMATKPSFRELRYNHRYKLYSLKNRDVSLGFFGNNHIVYHEIFTHNMHANYWVFLRIRITLSNLKGIIGYLPTYLHSNSRISLLKSGWGLG